jgi:glycerol-3-phosphate O-acyltransferase
MESATTARHLHPVADETPVVVLADAGTSTEQALISGWAHTNHPNATLLYAGDPTLAERLRQGDDPRVLPVRVTWLPRERDGGRRTRAADLLALTNPHRPWASLQARIAKREPDRARVTAGEGARASELRERFRRVSGAPGDEAFGAFVQREATVAVERSERAVIGDRYKVPRLVAEQITASAPFREEIGRLADRLGRPPADVMADATICLRELVAVQSRLAIDTFRLVMSPLHARAWDVEVDVESLERLRELNRRHALIFLPSHRSYSDPLVLAGVLDEHDFPRNHLLAGGNMSFWPIGPLGKRAGLVFIRRTFGDDAIYKLAVREYFGYLVAKRFNIEWYLEGGRTRTGKLRPPRFGLLRYLVRALEDERAEDVILVPVSIVYDQLSEVGAMAEEQVGATKSSEGLRWLADYVRAQRHNVGAAQVRFGEAFSLRGALEEAGDDGVQLEKVAFRVLDGINRATPITSTSLVTFALLGSRDRAFTLEQVARVVAPLLDLVEQRGIPGPVEGLRQEHGLRKTLGQLVAAGVVQCYDGGAEPVWSIAPGRHHVAAFYRNGVLHHFVNRALVELALLRLGQSEPVDDPIEAAWEDALAIRDLLKFEFFFADKATFRQELGAELDLFAADWRDRIGSPEEMARLVQATPTFVAHRALRSFLDAQYVVAKQLAARNPREGFDEPAFLAECLGVGRQLLLQGRLHGPESVSRELYAAALQLAANRDIVDPGREEVSTGRERFLTEIEEVQGRVSHIGRLDAERLALVLGR